MATSSTKKDIHARRRGRIRARITGTKDRPRLAVFRSNRYVYAQLIDDVGGTTVVSADSRNASGKTARERATATGTELAADAQKKNITAVVFDRGGFRYQGLVAALADGAREGGLIF